MRKVFLKHYPRKSEELPLVVCPNGAILKNPSEADLGRVLRMVPPDREGRRYDGAIVGAGPGGLAAAVYAASEGLSVGVFDAPGVRGQAGANSCIENRDAIKTYVEKVLVPELPDHAIVIHGQSLQPQRVAECGPLAA